MEKIIWVDKQTNKEILHMVQERRKIPDTIGHKWFCHVLRHSEVLHDTRKAKEKGKKTDIDGKRLDRK